MVVHSFHAIRTPSISSVSPSTTRAVPNNASSPEANEAPETAEATTTTTTMIVFI